MSVQVVAAAALERKIGDGVAAAESFTRKSSLSLVTTEVVSLTEEAVSFELAVVLDSRLERFKRNDAASEMVRRVGTLHFSLGNMEVSALASTLLSSSSSFSLPDLCLGRLV